MAANPARSQLKKENEYFPAPVRAIEFGVPRRVQLSRLAPASLIILHTQAEHGAYSRAPLLPSAFLSNIILYNII